jgi:dTDP-4-amino-4,6-dideoxygalactose transaminase
MSEVCAAMGLVNLRHLDEVVAQNRRAHARYTSLLSNAEGVSVVQPDPRERHNHQYVVLEVDHPRVTRDEVLARLHSHDVLARRYFWPGVHRMEPYASSDPAAGKRLAATEKLADKILVLPTGPSMSEEDIDRVATHILEALNGE